MNDDIIVIKRSMSSIILFFIFVIVCLALFTDIFDSKAKKEFRSNVEDIIRITTEKCKNNYIEGKSHISLYVLDDKDPTGGLPIKNDNKLRGKISVDNECKLILGIHNKNYKAVTNQNFIIDYKKVSFSTKCKLDDKKLEIGSKVRCNEQYFNVIDINDDDITLLSSYNIDTTTNKQDIKDTGNPSINAIPFDNINNRTSSNNTYCQRTQYGCNIYEKLDDELVNGVITGTVNEDSNIKILVDKYAIMLDLDNNIKFQGLITKTQLEKLGCIGENNDCKLSNKPWLYNTTYWTSSYYTGSPSLVWRIVSGGFLGTGYANYDNNTGLRPIITIPKNYIK